MKLIHILNQAYPELALEELRSVVGTTIHPFNPFIVTSESTDSQAVHNLALTHETWKFVISFPLTEKKSFFNSLENELPLSFLTNLTTHSFAFRFEDHSEHKSFVTEKETADCIHGVLSEKGIRPKVDLKEPEILLKGIIQDNHFFLGILIQRADTSWRSRRSHLRPQQKPISISPRLAHALVNCLGAAPQETIIDPFCGTGGFLIEGKRLGKNVRGSDIDSEMIALCQKNLTMYGFPTTSLERQDAFVIRQEYPYLITDLPYFKNTKKSLSLTFYTDVVAHFFPLVKKRMIICFPDKEEITQPIRTLLHQYQADVKEFSIYLHKSLQKKIYIISKRTAIDG